MMITSYSGPQTLGLPFNKATQLTPTFYVAASLTVPTFAQGSSPYWNFTEPTDPAYARQALPSTTGTVGTLTYEISAGTLSFPTCSTTWTSDALYLGIFDALTAGNLWFFLPVTRVVTDGVTTSGSTNVTSATADFVTGDVGAQIQAVGLPLGTTIVSRTSATEVVVSAEANASGTALTLAIATPQAVASGNVLTIPSTILLSQ